MKRKIILSLFALFIFFSSGAVMTSLYIANTTAELNRLITLHQVERLRQDLVINIQNVQTDLYAFNTPVGRNIDSIVNDMRILEKAAGNCTTCHHPPELTTRIEEVQALIKNYAKAVGYYITASADSGMTEDLKLNAAATGNNILTLTKDMSFAANRKLGELTSNTMAKINKAKKILFITLIFTFLLSFWVAVHLTISVTRPINELVNATRMIASGDLGYRIPYKDKTEFGDLARNFNTMSVALKDSYENLKAANEQLQQEITVRKQVEDTMKKSERFLNIIFDSIRDPFCIFDSDFRIIRANEAYAEMKNKRVEDLIGKRCYEILHDRTSICKACLVKKTFNSADPCAKEKFITDPQGLETWIEIYTYPIYSEDGEVSHIIEYAREISDRKKSEQERKRLIEELEYLSRTDGLTGLLNRRALIETLEYEIERRRRYNSELSLILCDIDYFKEINDTYGHAAGDEVLQGVSEILREAIRSTDIAGRYGGDEFMLILPGTSRTGAENLAEKIRSSIGKTRFQLTSEKLIKLSLSLGVAVFETVQDDADALINRADHALYASKRRGRNKV